MVFRSVGFILLEIAWKRAETGEIQKLADEMQARAEEQGVDLWMHCYASIRSPRLPPRLAAADPRCCVTDAEAEERRRLTLVLADQRAAPPTPARRSWLPWRRG